MLECSQTQLVVSKSWRYLVLGNCGSAVCLIPKEFVQAALPLFFLAVIVLVAIRLGALAGALGTSFALVIFALFLRAASQSCRSQPSREERFNLDVPRWACIIGTLWPASEYR